MENQELSTNFYPKIIFRTNSKSNQHKDKYAPYKNYIKKKYGPNDPKYLQLNKGNLNNPNQKKLKIQNKNDQKQTVVAKASRYRDQSFGNKSRPSSAKKSTSSKIQSINQQKRNSFKRKNSLSKIHSTIKQTNNIQKSIESQNFIQKIYFQNQKLRKQLEELKIKQGTQQIKEFKNINQFLLKQNYKLKTLIEKLQKENQILQRQIQQYKNKIQIINSQKSIQCDNLIKSSTQKKKVNFKLSHDDSREQSFQKEIQIIQLKEQNQFLNKKIKQFIQKNTGQNYKKLQNSIISQTVTFTINPSQIQQENSQSLMSQNKISIGLIKNKAFRGLQFVRRATNARRTSYDFRLSNFQHFQDAKTINNGERRISKKMNHNNPSKTILSSRNKQIQHKTKENFQSFRKFYFSHQSLAYQKRKLLTLQMIQRTITHKFKALNMTYQDWQQKMCHCKNRLITVQQIFQILKKHPFSLPDNLILILIQYCFQSYVSQQDACQNSHFALKMRQFIKDYIPLTQQQQILIRQKTQNFIASNQIELKQNLVMKQNRQGEVSQKVYQSVLKNFRISDKQIGYIISNSVFISRDSNHINYRRFFENTIFSKQNF